MHKHQAYEHIKQTLPEDQELIGFFIAQRCLQIWLFLLIGPLALLNQKAYFVAVTNKGVHFYGLNLLGKFSQHDFFTYDEIDSLKIGKGMLQIPMKYKFAGGKKLNIRAQKKGVDRVAKIDEATLEFLKKNTEQF